MGFGAALGNGCTSGHGICGNARLSLRSLVATCTFMAAGIATATLTGSLRESGLAGAAPLPGVARYSAIPLQDVQQGLVLLAASTCVLAGLYAVVRWSMRFQSSAAVHSWPPGPSYAAGSEPSSPSGAAVVTAAIAVTPPPGSAAVMLPGGRRLLDSLAELACGVVFGLGLAFSGMTRPSKVLGFLSIGASAPGAAFRLLAGWDASLMFVMGGALLLALPAFQLVARGRLLGRPLLADRFSCPAAARVDARLLAGAAVFGAGWGAGGICPGPGLVALAAADARVIAFVAAMCAGMLVEKVAREQPSVGAAAAPAAAASCKA